MKKWDRPDRFASEKANSRQHLRFTQENLGRYRASLGVLRVREHTGQWGERDLAALGRIPVGRCNQADVRPIGEAGSQGNRSQQGKAPLQSRREGLRQSPLEHRTPFHLQTDRKPGGWLSFPRTSRCYRTLTDSAGSRSSDAQACKSRQALGVLYVLRQAQDKPNP